MATDDGSEPTSAEFFSSKVGLALKSSIYDNKNDQVVEEGYFESSTTNNSLDSNSFDYEDVESIESSCQLRRYTIQPKALNNIYNEFTRVVNNSSFVQSITIEQCL